MEVDAREHEGGQGESAQSKGRRVGELAILDGLVQTRLELTTKRWQTSFIVAVQVHVGVAAVVVALLRRRLCAIGIVAGGLRVLLELGIRHIDWWSLKLARREKEEEEEQEKEEKEESCGWRIERVYIYII